MNNAFLHPDRRFRPVAFWFLNHDLETAEIRRQIAAMAEQGLGGVILHPRDGLRTDYLSETFAARLEDAIAAAEQHGMTVWLYDELHYPSGAAGFKLDLTGNRVMQTLRVTAESQLAPGASYTPAAPFAMAVESRTGETVELPPSLSWRVPENWNGAHLFELRPEPWQAVAGSFFDTYPDYTDPELTDEFIAITHQWYVRHFSRHFGHTVRGIFSDNSCGNFGAVRRGIPWGRDFEARFEHFTGEKLRPHLPRLLDSTLPGSQRSRLLFWNFFNHAYLDSYFRRITAYCTSVGLLSTGHLACEDGMGEHVRQVGDYFDVMRHFTYSAVDDLGPARPGSSLLQRSDDAGNLPHKLTCSAARFLGREEVMCECLGLASEPWKLTLFEIRRITGWLATVGINVFVPHALFYSIAGNRKWECPPDHLHNPIWRHYHDWTDWIGRLSQAGRGGVNRAAVAVLYPITTLQTTVELGRGAGMADDRGERTLAVERIFRGTVDRLLAEHIDFEIIDEKLLAAADVLPDGQLQIHAADSRFDLTVRTLILPAVEILHHDAVAKLREFAAGGRLIQLSAPVRAELDPAMRIIPVQLPGAAIAFDRLDWNGLATRLISVRDADGRETGNILCRSWIRDGVHWYLLFNHTAVEQTVKIRLSETQPLRRLNPEDGRFYSWESSPDPTVIFPAEALLLTTLEPDEILSEPVLPTEQLPLPEVWRFTAADGNLWPLRQWTTRVENGRQLHTFHFRVEDVPATLRLLLDLERSRSELAAGHFGSRVQCRLNGNPVMEFQPGTRLDRYLYEADIAGLTIPGDNVFELSCDSLSNDWERRLCPPLLAGAFALVRSGDGWTMRRESGTIRRGSWTEQGYPFYSGEGSYRQTATLPPHPVRLDLGPQPGAVTLAMDGTEVGTRVAPPWVFDLTPWAGKTVELELRVINTPTNLWTTESEPAGFLPGSVP